VKLEGTGHDVTDFQSAVQRGYEWGEEIPIGLFWQRTDLPALHELEPVLERGPVARQPLGIDATAARALIAELM
jgi:2-oxoglutarate ferredoxin oxidoreductase subunit beta